MIYSDITLYAAGAGANMILRETRLPYSDVPAAQQTDIWMWQPTSGLAATPVYPVANNVRDGIYYGPAGTDYTGNIKLPAAPDVKLGVSYGANGTEATGTLAGGGGGKHIVIVGGWG